MYGFVTIVTVVDETVQVPGISTGRCSPIVTFSNMAISESKNEGRMKDCFVKLYDQYVDRAQADWSAKR